MRVVPTSPDAPAAVARACASPVTPAAVISPPKRESDVTCDHASASAAAEPVAATLVVTEPAAATDPSAG